MCTEVQKPIQLQTEITEVVFSFFQNLVRTRKQGTRSLESNQVRNPDPKVYQINSWGRNRRDFRFGSWERKCSWKAGTNRTTLVVTIPRVAIEHFGQILGKLSFKCRQLQVPILPGSDTLQICSPYVCQGLKTKEGTHHTRWDHRLEVPTCCGRAEQGGPQTHLSRVQTSVIAGIWTLNTLRFLSPVWEIRVKEPPLPGIWQFPAPTNPLSPVIWSKYKPLPGFVKEAEKSLWLFDSF
jgi:hypothetical protein